MVAVGDKVRAIAPKGRSDWGSWPKWNGKVCLVTRVTDYKSLYVTHPDSGDEGYLAENCWEAVDKSVDDLRNIVDSLREQGYTVEVTVTPPGETITL